MGVIRRTLVLAVIATLAVAGPAAAKPKRITYYDGSGYAAAVQIAVGQWNSVQTAIRFVPATNPKKALLPITSVDTGRANAAGGALGVIINKEAFDHFTLPQQASIVSHVIGHVLRLDDRKRGTCAIMSADLHNADLNAACRPSHTPGSRYWRCGANTSDAKAVVKLYGGKVHPSTGYCQLPEGALNLSVTDQHAALDGTTLQDVLQVASAGTASVLPGDVGLVVGSGFYPLDGAVAAGTGGTITYPACLSVTQGQLYSPTYDTFLGAPVPVASPC